MDGQHHVTFLVCSNCVRVGCYVVKEPFDEEDCVRSGFGLGCGK